MTATITSLRQQVSELHPHLIDQVGLEPALRQAGERAARRGGFELRLELDRDGPGPNDGVLFRCASELLANAATHARAQHVTLSLRNEGGADVLEVADDGVGFDPARLDERLREGHIGVLSLRERAEGLGGTLEIERARAPARGSAARRAIGADCLKGGFARLYPCRGDLCAARPPIHQSCPLTPIAPTRTSSTSAPCSRAGSTSRRRARAPTVRLCRGARRRYVPAAPAGARASGLPFRGGAPSPLTR